MSTDGSLQERAQRCVLDITRNFPDKSFVLLAYDNKTYMGAARVLESKDDNSIVLVNRILPYIQQDLADYILHHRPGVAKLNVDHEIHLLTTPVFRASLQGSSLHELTAEQKTRVVRLESFE